tara:strand:+ start:335 stop:892 length:558 start_codon:yes stop_codon:yes gene_type:complete
MAPSGSGKGTLLKGLGELAERIYFAKTYTSREPRKGAAENPKYVFVSRDEFEELIKNDEMIEWAEFSANYYGTPRSEFTDPLAKDQVVMKEMELQGVEQIQALLPKEQCTVIYIDAGSWEDLKERIIERAPISDEHLELRCQRYQEESKFKEQADVIIRNHNGRVEEAQEEFRQVIKSILDKHSV